MQVVAIVGITMRLTTVKTELNIPLTLVFADQRLNLNSLLGNNKLRYVILTYRTNGTDTCCLKCIQVNCTISVASRL
jgi:hypothetical protein